VISNVISMALSGRFSKLVLCVSMGAEPRLT